MDSESGAIASTGDCAEIDDVQIIQHFDASLYGSPNKTTGSGAVKNNIMHTLSDGYMFNQRKRACVIEIAASLENQYYGFLLGR